MLSSLTHHRFDFGMRTSESATESFVLLRFGVVHHRLCYLSVTCLPDFSRSAPDATSGTSDLLGVGLALLLW